MSKFTQSQLQRHLEILVTNGQLAPAQAVIAPVGYNAAALEAGNALLQEWLAQKTRARALLAAQKQATADEVNTRRAAEAELSKLSQAVRTLFGADTAVLTSLGLLPRRSRSNGVEPAANGSDPEAGSPNGQNHHPGRLSTSLAAIVARGRLLLANIQTLSAAQLSELAAFGWTGERLAAAAALVEAAAAAHTGQKQKMQSYRAAAAAATEAELATRRWYDGVARRSRLAIKQADPGNRDHLRGLLGL